MIISPAAYPSGLLFLVETVGDECGEKADLLVGELEAPYAVEAEKVEIQLPR